MFKIIKSGFKAVTASKSTLGAQYQPTAFTPSNLSVKWFWILSLYVFAVPTGLCPRSNSSSVDPDKSTILFGFTGIVASPLACFTTFVFGCSFAFDSSFEKSSQR